MTDILTLTMNPALDVLTTYDKVESTHKMRCGPTLKHPGGGGVNVARVLHRLGASCLAVYPAGGITGWSSAMAWHLVYRPIFMPAQPLPNEASWKSAAQQLIQSGQTQVVALSLGDQGAMLITDTQTWRAQSLRVNVQTTIGAGDSFVAAMVWGLRQGLELPNALRYGMAAGAAALLSPGTELSQASGYPPAAG